MAVKFIFNPFPLNPSRISTPSKTLICSFNPNFSSSFSSSSSRRKPLSAKPPARDRVIDFGKYKGQMLGTLPPDYLKWISKNLTTRDSEFWVELVEEVLKDPVYKDRIEWELIRTVMEGGDVGTRRTDNHASRFTELVEEFGWDWDNFGPSGVVYDYIGTSKSGRIPKKNSSSSPSSPSSPSSRVSRERKLISIRDSTTSRVSQIGKIKTSSSTEFRREGKLGGLSKEVSRVPPVEAEKVAGNGFRGSREERIERQRLKRGLQLHKLKLGIEGKKKEEDRDEQDQDEDRQVERAPSNLRASSSPFPGRETLLKKAMAKRKVL